jgi:hypothetical protein
METNGKSRVIMLAVSGLLFGATAFGWWVHESNKNLEPTEVAAINQPIVGASAQQIAAPAASDIAAEAPVIAAATASQVYPSTSMEDAVRAARTSIKKDPTRPMNWGGSHAEQPERRFISRHSNNYGRSSNNYVPPPPNTRLIDPPPVGEPSGIALGYPVAAPEAEPKRPTVDDVRLVGVIDGKAIFKVNRHAADRFALPNSFTLGKGESFGNIKLQAVGKDDAILHDGSKVATKSLDPVH